MKKEEIELLFSQFEQVACMLNKVECFYFKDLFLILHKTRRIRLSLRKIRNNGRHTQHNIQVADFHGW